MSKAKKFNLYAREIIEKHGKMPYVIKDLSHDANTHRSIVEYVMVPFNITESFTEAEGRQYCKGLGLPYSKSTVSGMTCRSEAGMDILRQRMMKAYAKGEFTNNTYDMTKWWSRDGKHVYLYSGIAKDEPYMSWSCQMFIAHHFTTNKELINLESNGGKEMEVRVMKVPLDRINEFTYYTIAQAMEVLVDTDHPTFKEFYAESFGLTPDEAVEHGALFVDPFYDYPGFDFPRPLLAQWNDYPYSLAYPPYPREGEHSGGDRWCYETRTYIKE